MRAKKNLTFGAFQRGEGTKKQRSALLAMLSRLGPRLKESGDDFLEAADALAAIGLTVAHDEDLRSALRRADGHPGSAPVVALIRKVQALRASARDEQDERGRVASRSAGRSRVGEKVTAEMAREFVATFSADYGTERGAKTAGAIHFNVDLRTFSDLLCT